MVRGVFLSLVFLLSSLSATVYEENCVSCHKRLPVSIDKYFYKYLLIYSSETDTKNAIINYLKVPVKETTVMSDSFISRFGVKQRTTLTEKQLQEAVDEYWQRYKVFGKLK